MSEPGEVVHGKTMLRRIEQYRDRWTSFGATTGIRELSDKPSPAELRELDLFADYDDAFLEQISSDVSIAVWEPGATLFEEGAYLDLAFFVVRGEVEVFVRRTGGGGAARPIFDLGRTGFLQAPGATDTQQIPQIPRPKTVQDQPPAAGEPSEITFLATMDFDLPRDATARLGPGEIFGEIGAMSGWPQAVTARTVGECRLVQIRANALRRMKRKSPGLKERLDAVYRQRSLAAQLKASPLLADCDPAFIEELRRTVELVSLEPGEAAVREGEPAEALYLVRSGFVKLVERFGPGEGDGDAELAVSYLSKGMTLGEVELLVDGVERWRVTAVSVEYANLVRIPRVEFERLLAAHPAVEERLWRSAVDRIRDTGHGRRQIGRAGFLQTALDTGLVQGNSILVIDLDTCTRCDDCVRACEATHDGRQRFMREGHKVGNLLVAKSCFHCRDPVCLVGCPTGAIHRAGVGDVVAVDDSICIGCSSCANNCPYDAIVMHDTGETWPDDMVPVTLRGRDRKVASKCDLCYDAGHGPACVSNCPQGCAYRVGSLDEFEELLRRRS